MAQNNYNSVLITDKLEHYYRKKLSEEKIMKSQNNSKIYIWAVRVMLIGVIFLSCSIFPLLKISLQVKSPLDFFQNLWFSLLFGLGMILFFGGSLFKNYTVIKILKIKYRYYRIALKNPFSFKNAQKLLDVYRYDQLIKELKKTQYANVDLDKLIQTIKEKSNELQKQRFIPLTISSVLVLAVWGALLSALISNPKLIITAQVQLSFVFFLASLVIALAVYTFIKWYELTFLGRAKTLSQLAANLNQIALKRHNN